MLRFHRPFLSGNAKRLSPTSGPQAAPEPGQLLLPAGSEEPPGLTPDLQPSTGDTPAVPYQQVTDTGTTSFIVVQLSN